VLRLDAGNFELAVQSYDSLAVLFYDGSAESSEILRRFEKVRRWIRSREASMGADGVLR
jgi:hypothetical protein